MIRQSLPMCITSVIYMPLVTREAIHARVKFAILNVVNAFRVDLIVHASIETVQ